MKSNLTVNGTGQAHSGNSSGSKGRSGEICDYCQRLQPTSPWTGEVAWTEHRFEVPVKASLDERKMEFLSDAVKVTFQFVINGASGQWIELNAMEIQS